MAIVIQLGRLSDCLTDLLLRKQSAPASADLVRDRQGFVRKAQLSAIMATSRPMMIANICNAMALVALEHHVGRLDLPVLLWAATVLAFAGSGLSSAREFYKKPGKSVASVRAPGKVVLSSLVLALIWCYPLLFILPFGDLLEVAFISALTAGMVAGGALALYPVPLAGFIYIAILSSVAFVTVVLTGVLPSLPFGLVIGAFALVVAFSVRRHTGMFLSELVGKLEAERQRDMVNLLLDTYQGEGGQYLWRSDSWLNLTTLPEPLFQMIGLEHAKPPTSNLIDILRNAEAVGYDPESAFTYSNFNALNRPAHSDFEMTLRIHNGRVLKLAGRSEVDEGVGQIGFHGYLKDVTGEVRATEKVYHLATRDTMTGLLNYQEFSRRAAAKLEAMKEQSGDALFIFLDADNLKTVNDNFGHAIGDQLIVAIAERLGEQMPDDSLVARKGGDEFVALITGAGDLDVTDWANDTIKAICGCFCCADLQIPVSCCLGVSLSPHDTARLEALELEADRALYFAKSQGKRQARIYDETIGEQIQRDRMLALDLGAAMTDGKLRLVFQPIVDLRTDAIIGAEALLRWRHPTFGDVSPEKVVSIAQAEALGPALLEYVLGRAMTQAALWPTQAFVSVNMHSADLQRGNLKTRVADILESTGFPANRLWLEVTESESLRDSIAVQDNLNALRASGVSIAIDDFGAGYSSLSYLSRYPSDVIKIDKSLIRGCDHSESNKIIIKAMKSLASVSGWKVVAEGVESQREIDVLKKDGFEMVQGFACHKPLSPTAMRSLLDGLDETRIIQSQPKPHVA